MLNRFNITLHHSQNQGTSRALKVLVSNWRRGPGGFAVGGLTWRGVAFDRPD